MKDNYFAEALFKLNPKCAVDSDGSIVCPENELEPAADEIEKMMETLYLEQRVKVLKAEVTSFYSSIKNSIAPDYLENVYRIKAEAAAKIIAADKANAEYPGDAKIILLPESKARGISVTELAYNVTDKAVKAATITGMMEGARIRATGLIESITNVTEYESAVKNLEQMKSELQQLL